MYKLNGTSRSEDGESRWEDNIPKTLQRAYFPIAEYSEYERRENQSEKKKPDQINQKNMLLQLTSICSGVHESRLTDFTRDM